jgi:hypothetical protein
MAELTCKAVLILAAITIIKVLTTVVSTARKARKACISLLRRQNHEKCLKGAAAFS